MQIPVPFRVIIAWRICLVRDYGMSNRDKWLHGSEGSYVRGKTRPWLIALAVITGAGTAAVAATAAIATTATPAATTAVTAVATIQPRVVAPAINGIPQVARPGGQSATAGAGTAGAATKMTPAASSPQDSFSDVSCLNPKDCIGVGGNAIGDSGFSSPLFGLWNGSAWKAGTPPLPHGALGGELFSVSCRPGGCVAIGYYWVGSKYTPLAELWNGARWSLLTQPALPAGASSGLLSVISCTTDTNCVSTGVYRLGTATGGLLETWAGSTWHIVHLSSPKTPASELASVSCATAAYCVAVGTYVGGTNNANSYTLADVLSGGTWHLVTPANPNTAAGYQDVLQSVSCAPGATAPPMCVAVGTVGKQSGKIFYATGFSEAWNGTAWSSQAVSWPSGSHSVLYGVSCPSTQECVAVGGTGVYATYNDGTKAAQVWNGTSWSLATLPAASGGVGSVLFGVQCLPATTPTCAAAGEVGPYTTPGHALTGFWNGTTWKLVTTA
jgi:hypothetical protein